jgi:hypothetical protein
MARSDPKWKNQLSGTYSEGRSLVVSEDWTGAVWEAVQVMLEEDRKRGTGEASTSDSLRLGVDASSKGWSLRPGQVTSLMHNLALLDVSPSPKAMSLMMDYITPRLSVMSPLQDCQVC